MDAIIGNELKRVGRMARGLTLEDAARALDQEGIVIFPTETFYGLAARVDRPGAVSRVAELKGRVGQLPVIAADLENVRQWLALESELAQLADHFWPGPLTVVGEPKAATCPELTSPRGTVAVRVSSHPLAQALARASGGLITATSANSRGLPPPRSAGEVESKLLDSCAILDGGITAGGAPSTIVELAEGSVKMVREGTLSGEALAQVLGYLPVGNRA